MMIRRIGTMSGTALGWLLILCLLPLSSVLGSVATVLALLSTVLLAPFVWTRAGADAARRQPALLVFIAVVLVLAASFTITAQVPADTRYAANFLSLPLAVVVFLAARRAPMPGAILTLAILCFAGALAAAMVAGYDVAVMHKVRFLGYYMGPNVLARIALLMGFFGLIGVFASRSRWRYLLYLGPVAGLLATYLSGTRGALVIFPVLAVIYGVFLFSDRAERNWAHVLCSLAVLAFAVFTLTSDRMASIGLIAGNLAVSGDSGDASTAIRFALLSGAWELFQQAPLLGHGWASFARLATPVIGEDIVGGALNWNFQFHNDAANFAVAAGVVGLACLLALIAAPVAGVLRTPRDGLFRLRLYCCLSLGAWALISGLTDLTFGYDLPTTLYAFLTAIVLGAFVERPAVT
jgi:O-antigen ligase